jgi:hypothetical protein
VRTFSAFYDDENDKHCVGKGFFKRFMDDGGKPSYMAADADGSGEALVGADAEETGLTSAY